MKEIHQALHTVRSGGMTSVDRFLNEVCSAMEAKKGLEHNKKQFCNVYTIAETGPKPSPIPSINTLQDGRYWGFIVAFLCSICHISGIESPWLWLLFMFTEVMKPQELYEPGNEVVAQKAECLCWGALGTVFLFCFPLASWSTSMVAEMEEHLGQREKSEHWLC